MIVWLVVLALVAILIVMARYTYVRRPRVYPVLSAISKSGDNGIPLEGIHRQVTYDMPEVRELVGVPLALGYIRTWATISGRAYAITRQGARHLKKIS